MDKEKRKVVVGITMGDPSGIGPAIISKALPRVKGLADFVVVGDKWVFDKASNAQSPAANYRFIDLRNVSRKYFRSGEIKAEYGRASMEYLDKALLLAKDRAIDCLVTCPVSKEAVSLAGFNNFSGHTEYLSLRTRTKFFAMMLLNKILKFVVVTRHIPLKDVPRLLDADEIYKTVLLARRSLKELFLVKSPRIAVCGLNPHASDNGIMGEEEGRIIKPALARLGAGIKGVDGPLPADVAALKAAKKEYDCIIAMYHDQALIALKVSGGYTGANLTLGLPFIRTSPLHGTAFDISGDFNLTDPSSLIEAINLAVKCTLNRRKA